MNHSCDKCVEYTNQMLAQHARIVELETAVRPLKCKKLALKSRNRLGRS
jgi:hypothetical protein